MIPVTLGGVMAVAEQERILEPANQPCLPLSRLSVSIEMPLLDASACLTEGIVRRQKHELVEGRDAHGMPAIINAVKVGPSGLPETYDESKIEWLEKIVCVEGGIRFDLIPGTTLSVLDNWVKEVLARRKKACEDRELILKASKLATAEDIAEVQAAAKD
jgi:hypothetical protein